MTEDGCVPDPSAEDGSWHLLVRDAPWGFLQVKRMWHRGMWSRPGSETQWTPAYAAKHGWEYFGRHEIVPIVDLPRLGELIERQARQQSDMREMAFAAINSFHALSELIRALKAENELLRYEKGQKS